MNRAIIKILKIYFFVTFFSPYIIEAQNAPTTSEQCQQLIQKGIDKNNQGKFSEALEILIKAESSAEKNKWYDKQSLALNNIGLAYGNLSNYGEALGYYQKALKIAESYKIYKVIPLALANIGVLYTSEKDYKTALYYYLRAYALTNSTNLSNDKAIIAVNISDTYNKLKKFNEARRYIDEVENIKKSKEAEYFLKLNYAETFFVEGRFDESKRQLQALINEVDKNKYTDCYIYIVELLSKIYLLKNNTPVAISYAKEGLISTTKLRRKLELYQQLSYINYKIKDIENYKRYNDSTLLAKDLLNSKINRGLFESNKVKFKIQEFQNEAKSYKDKQEAERKIFIISIIFSIIVFLLIYRTLKNRITKQKQEKVIAENQQKIISLELEKRNLELEKRNSENLLLEQQMREKETNALLEQERLINEIDKRNRQLSAKALNLSGRNQLIEEVINSFYQNPKISSDPVLLKHINDLKTNLKTDEWESFILHFEEVNNNMLKRLQALYPSLTPHDLRFIAYLYMNLSYKEIAIIFNITAAACSKRRERIMAKMDVPKDVSLHAFISGF
jgi:DNA-binding CsgD family transcriptional regulator